MYNMYVQIGYFSAGLNSQIRFIRSALVESIKILAPTALNCQLKSNFEPCPLNCHFWGFSRAPVEFYYDAKITFATFIIPDMNGKSSHKTRRRRTKLDNRIHTYILYYNTYCFGTRPSLEPKLHMIIPYDWNTVCDKGHTYMCISLYVCMCTCEFKAVLFSLSHCKMCSYPRETYGMHILNSLWDFQNNGMQFQLSWFNFPW